jgi:hypothetical protein
MVVVELTVQPAIGHGHRLSAIGIFASGADYA